MVKQNSILIFDGESLSYAKAFQWLFGLSRGYFVQRSQGHLKKDQRIFFPVRDRHLFIDRRWRVIIIFLKTMRRKRSECSIRKMKISVKRRMKLIDLVQNQHYSVVRASRKLELRPYTARSIVNKYRKDGVVYDFHKREFVHPDPPTPQNLEKEENRIKQEDLNSEEPESPSAPINIEQVKIEEPQPCYNQIQVPQALELPNPGCYLFYFWQ